MEEGEAMARVARSLCSCKVINEVTSVFVCQLIPQDKTMNILGYYFVRRDGWSWWYAQSTCISLAKILAEDLASNYLYDCCYCHQCLHSVGIWSDGGRPGPLLTTPFLATDTLKRGTVVNIDGQRSRIFSESVFQVNEGFYIKVANLISTSFSPWDLMTGRLESHTQQLSLMSLFHTTDQTLLGPYISSISSRWNSNWIPFGYGSLGDHALKPHNGGQKGDIKGL